jgi:hypothetical protein
MGATVSATQVAVATCRQQGHRRPHVSVALLSAAARENGATRRVSAVSRRNDASPMVAVVATRRERTRFARSYAVPVSSDGGSWRQGLLEASPSSVYGAALLMRFGS